MALYRYDSDSLDYLRIRFTDLSYFQPDTWFWDLGDGSTFNGGNLTVTLMREKGFIKFASQYPIVIDHTPVTKPSRQARPLQSPISVIVSR